MVNDPTPPATAPRRNEAATAYLLLTFTALLWGGNAVAGKWAVGEVSPQVLTTLRWVLAFAALIAFTGRRSISDLPRLRPHWLYVLLMGATGFTAFASLFYIAGETTSALNLALIQGLIPVLVVLINLAVSRIGVTSGQAVGLVITLFGAVVATTHGDWAVLKTLSFKFGDALMVAACLLYAGYAVALARRPKVAGLTFFTALSAAAALTSFVPLAAEWASGHLQWPTPRGWLIVAYVALGPTLVGQLLFIRGVEMIGPNRAGLFVNLVPVFGAMLAVLVAREAFGPTEALALILVLGGIAIAERFRARPAP
ncbi:DMT family transporter [Methylobacterium gnaphalii]|uniref:DMT family transporter n=1 Tax=Methylobacterium gnaphalii TaxID=1010610 RepID=UPI003570F7B4